MNADVGNIYYTCVRFQNFVFSNSDNRNCRYLFYGISADQCAELASAMAEINSARFIEIKAPSQNAEQKRQLFRDTLDQLEGAELLVLIRVADIEDGKFVEQLRCEADELDVIVKIGLVLDGGEFILDPRNDSARKFFQPLDLLFRDEPLPNDCPGREEELKMFRIS